MKKILILFITIIALNIKMVSARIPPVLISTAMQKLSSQKQKQTQQLVKDYYPDGKVKSEGYYTAEGQLNGEFKSYYPNGNLFEKGYYKDGVPNGNITVYYENGKVMCESYAKSGHLSGNVRCYYPNGHLKSESYTEDGIIQKGVATHYYENGQIAIYSVSSQGAILSFDCYDENGNLLTAPQDIKNLLLSMGL